MLLLRRSGTRTITDLAHRELWSAALYALCAVPWGGKGSAFMKSYDFESQTIDELWSLHELVTSTLARKIAAAKAKLEHRLLSIEKTTGAIGRNPPRRRYPKVLPKYQNPNDAAELWSGRGKQPLWLKAQLKAGKKIEHFLIARPSIERHRRAGG